MAIWERIKIQRENGEEVDAQAPVIISASRSTDIPAFYADWFFNRLKIGYSAWVNPFNGVKNYVSYKNTRFIVFWSKNPKPLLKYIDVLKKRKINCYIQFSLNDYVNEKLEDVPSVDERIETFKELVDRLGKGHVIWRFDPLVLTNEISIDTLLKRIERIGDALLGYTEKLVFSFVDISIYKKVQSNLDKGGIHYIEWTKDNMVLFARKLVEMNKLKWNYELATCGELEDLEGVQHNHCVDDNLMIRLAYKDEVLMNFLGVEIRKKETNSLFDGDVSLPEGAILLPDNLYAIKTKNNKDKGQRKACGCMISKDIGEYNTCIHGCVYCYANSSKDIAKKNYMRAKETGFKAETITGK